MRLLEVDDLALTIRATRRFMKSLATYLKGYPQLEKNLRDFCADKALGKRYGRKDAPYTGAPLRGTWHAHLVHGKLIVIYDLRNGTLDLFDLSDHDATEGKGVVDMAKYIRGLRPSDLTGVNLGAGEEAPSGLPADEVAALRDLFYEIAASDPGIIRAALAGDLSDLLYFAQATIERDRETILVGLGGRNALMRELAKIANTVGMS